MPLIDKEIDQSDFGVWATNESDGIKKTSDSIDLHKEVESEPPIPLPRKSSTKRDSEKYLDTKSLDSVGLTDVESIMTLDDLQAPTKTSS